MVAVDCAIRDSAERMRVNMVFMVYVPTQAVALLTIWPVVVRHAKRCPVVAGWVGIETAPVEPMESHLLVPLLATTSRISPV